MAILGNTISQRNGHVESIADYAAGQSQISTLNGSSNTISNVYIARIDLSRHATFIYPIFPILSTFPHGRCIFSNRVDRRRIESRNGYTFRRTPDLLNCDDQELDRPQRRYTIDVDVVGGVGYIPRGAGFAYLRAFLKLIRSRFGARGSLSQFWLYILRRPNQTDSRK